MSRSTINSDLEINWDDDKWLKKELVALERSLSWLIEKTWDDWLREGLKELISEISIIKTREQFHAYLERLEMIRSSQLSEIVEQIQSWWLSGLKNEIKSIRNKWELNTINIDNIDPRVLKDMADKWRRNSQNQVVNDYKEMVSWSPLLRKIFWMDV